MKHINQFISFIGMILIVFVCFDNIALAKRDDETKMTSYMTAKELVGIAIKAYPKGLMTGMATTLPIPTKKNSRLQIVVFLYKESTKMGDETIFPPHHLVAIDPTNGKVLRNEPCTPKTFGISQATGIPVVGFGLDPGMSAEVFWKKHDRFMGISSEVWKAYASGTPHLPGESAQLVREYAAIFSMIAKKPLLPYYHAVAPDLFKWLEQVAR